MHIVFTQFPRLVIQKSYAVFRKYDVHVQLKCFRGFIPKGHDSYLVYTGSFRPDVQSAFQHTQAKRFFSIMPPTKRQRKEEEKNIGKYWAEREHSKAFKNFICASAEGKKTAFRKVCLKSVKVMVFWV